MKKKINWILFLIIIFTFFALEVGIYRFSSGELKLFFKRSEIVFLCTFFISLYCFFEYEKINFYIHKYRWWIALGIFAFCVLNCFNLSSIGQFDFWIQPGQGSEYIFPVFGQSRAIRSDEWMVTVPRVLGGSYSNYKGINNLACATKYNNWVSTGGIMWDYAELAIPSNWGYLLFGATYGLSFSWSYKLIFGFMFWYELFIILSKNKKDLSLFGATLIWFSTFNFWWSFVNQLLSGAAIIVLFYYYIKANKSILRLFLGLMLAIAGADFCIGLYPAWQVPMGYIILSILIWMIIDQKPWLKFSKKDWAIFLINICFMISIIARFLIVDSAYIDAIQKTVYPGARISYGGFSLNKLLGYFYVMLASVGVIENPCEIGCVPIAFPLGFILITCVLFKEKGKNSLLLCLLVPMIILLCYCSFELPHNIAKSLLLTYSTPSRAADFLGVLLLIVIVVCLSEIFEKNVAINYFEAAVIVLLSILPATFYCLGLENRRKYILAIILLAIVSIILLTFIICNEKKWNSTNFSILLISLCLFINAMMVNPIMVGTDAIFSKPLAKKIKEIVDVDKDSKWIALYSLVLPNYLISCGASTINSTNFIPNFKMWEILDPEKEYEEVWNRYSHMVMYLSDDKKSNYCLDSGDLMSFVISKSDFRKLEIDYVVSPSKVNDSWKDTLEEVYNEGNIFIYKSVYSN